MARAAEHSQAGKEVRHEELTHTSIAMPCTPDSLSLSRAVANHLEFAYLNCPSELTCTQQHSFLASEVIWGRFLHIMQISVHYERDLQ